MYTIPKELIAEWDRVKKGLPGAIDKIKVTSMVTAADKKELTKNAEKLVAEFDQGLKARMKVAAAAKDDAAARKAAAGVIAVVTDYRASITKHVQKWGGPGKSIAEPLDRVLVKIAQHAEASTKSRPPLKVPADLLTSLDKALATAVTQVGQLPGLDDDEAKALKRSVEKLVSDLNLTLKQKINPIVSAKSDDDIRRGAPLLMTAAENGRKRVRDWVSKEGRAAVPIAKTLDFAITKLGQSARTLQAQAG